jgi:hypothetical protein
MRKEKGMPQPPGFHWIFVLILEIVTVGLFGCVWAIVQALWAKKIDPSSKALTLYIVAFALSLAGAFDVGIALQAIFEVLSAVIATFGAFSVKDSLAGYIASVTKAPAYLSGLMTIIFGEVYLQYHMNRVDVRR